jgi:hypothetical protein
MRSAAPSRESLRGLERHYNIQVVSGGKHSAIRSPNGKKSPFPTRRTVPPDLINQIAHALGVTRKDVRVKCLTISM